MTTEITGKVSAISQKEGRYGVCINNTWLNSFGTCPVAKGDNVLIKYEINGDFKDIKQIGKRDVPTPQKPTGYLTQDQAEKVGIIPRKSVKGSAYEKDPVGLAVEVFCAIYDKTDSVSVAVMEIAINTVKQAQKAFS